MRIICPNCDAQYEVPGSVIPSEGRDVECSNCGKTWFQHHPDFPPEPVDSSPPVPPPVEEDTPAPAPEPQPQTSQAAARKRELDPSVADILREEAEREAAARAAETLEIQPDLNLPDVEPPAPAPPKPLAQDTKPKVGAAGAPVPDAGMGSRRELLPDIEEINSTLRSADDREVAEDTGAATSPPLARRRKRGFRNGFLVSIVLFGLAVLLYSFAPQIAEAIPQADPFISAYVTWMDNTRVWLNGRMSDLLVWLDAQAAAVDQE